MAPPRHGAAAAKRLAGLPALVRRQICSPDRRIVALLHHLDSRLATAIGRVPLAAVSESLVVSRRLVTPPVLAGGV